MVTATTKPQTETIPDAYKGIIDSMMRHRLDNPELYAHLHFPTGEIVASVHQVVDLDDVDQRAYVTTFPGSEVFSVPFVDISIMTQPARVLEVLEGKK